MKLFTPKRICLAAAVLLLVALLALLIRMGNARLTVTEYTLSLPALPQSFDGLRVVQISDLHDACFGEDQQLLADALRQLSPDIIIVTGDLFDSSRTDLENSLAAMRQAAEIASCYYAPGNHEQRRPVQYAALIRGLKGLGVTVLDDACVTLSRGSDSIRIAGLRDISFYEARYQQQAQQYGDEQLAKKLWLTQMKQLTEGSSFTLMLSHHPEYFASYCGAGVQLVFSGHAHGGQFRLPLVGGLFAPGQGLFPQYS
ncbi:MAG: metallophosphoesterase, partial [Oscillospiraceae bacterium]|nr:metallophosphoesterase [Oscillospiraceae bacterium]